MSLARATQVIHIREKQAGDVFIGRPSAWGNPFVIGRDGDRATVIAKYRSWLLADPQLLSRVGELKGRRLACYCAPQPCHGDVLAEFAELAAHRTPAPGEPPSAIAPSAAPSNGTLTASAPRADSSQRERNRAHATR